MGKNIFHLSLFVVLFMVSCNKNPVLGKWKDNIKLSQKTINFSSHANSVVVTTESTGWWLNGITFNDKRVDLKNIKNTDPSFVVVNDDFQIERKDGNKIIVTINQNTTGSDRKLSISLQYGDYFDGLNVTQSKN